MAKPRNIDWEFMSKTLLKISGIILLCLGVLVTLFEIGGLLHRDPIIKQDNIVVDSLKTVIAQRDNNISTLKLQLESFRSEKDSLVKAVSKLNRKETVRYTERIIEKVTGNHASLSFSSDSDSVKIDTLSLSIINSQIEKGHLAEIEIGKQDTIITEQIKEIEDLKAINKETEKLYKDKLKKEKKKRTLTTIILGGIAIILGAL